MNSNNNNFDLPNDHTSSVDNNTSHISELFEHPEHPIEANVAWGDSLTSKPPYHSRIYFQNINGLQDIYSWDRWKECVEEMKHYEVDIFGFAETNIAWEPTRIHKASQILRRTNSHAHMITSICDGSTGTKYQRGGTCTCITGNMAGMKGLHGNDGRGL